MKKSTLFWSELKLITMTDDFFTYVNNHDVSQVLFVLTVP